MAGSVFFVVIVAIGAILAAVTGTVFLLFPFVLIALGFLLVPLAMGGLLAALVMPTAEDPSATQAIAQQFLLYFMLSNIVLGLFNLLPIPPLDGGRIAVGLLPLPLARIWARLERAGILVVLLVVFILPRLIGFDPVGQALESVLPWAFRTLFWLAGHDLDGMDGSLI